MNTGTTTTFITTATNNKRIRYRNSKKIQYAARGVSHFPENITSSHLDFYQ